MKVRKKQQQQLSRPPRTLGHDQQTKPKNL
jgi:hypothetical protein